MKLNKFISELKRRNVFKSIIAYLAVSWIIVQIASILFPAFGAPVYALKALVYLLSFGLFIWIGVSWVYELTPEGIKKTEDYQGYKVDIQFENRKLNKFIVISLIIAIGLLISISFWAGSAWNERDKMLVTKKVAIIPFQEESRHENDEIFQSGMTKILIDELSKVDQLTVISQASSKVIEAGFSSGNSLVLDVIRGIDYYIYGNFIVDLNQVQIIIELKESIGAEGIWKKSYSGDVSEVRHLAARASDDLTRQMGLIVKNEDKVLWSNLQKVNPETFELYLKGKHYMNQTTDEDWLQGILYMKEAIDRNPSDAYAHAYMAEAYINLGHGPSATPDVFPKALLAAERAIELDSTLALGWAALSHYHTYFGRDWEMAEFAFKRANELNPNLAYNHYHRAWYLALFGRMNEAIEEHIIAQELDPFTPMHTFWLGELYRWVGKYDEGLEETFKAEEIRKDLPLAKIVRGNIYLDQGKAEEAMKELKKAYEINPGLKYFGYVPALIELGRMDEAKKLIQELEALPANAFFTFCLGRLYALMGDYDQAIECFNRDKSYGWYPWLRVAFPDNEIVNDPRFLKLIRDMNLPDPAPLNYTP